VFGSVFGVWLLKLGGGVRRRGYDGARYPNGIGMTFKVEVFLTVDFIRG